MSHARIPTTVLPHGKTLRMKALLGALILSCASVGCGARNLSSQSADGGAADSGAQGVGVASLCPAGWVTFRLTAAASDSGFYVFQAYPACSKSNWLKIFDPSGTERALIHPSTSIDCDTCSGATYPATCASTSASPTKSVTWTWDGQYFAGGTCGAATTACVEPRCADAGRYVVAMCASDDQQGTGTRCVEAMFDYPAAEPVTGVLAASAHN
jgi:hypothetical protein